MQVKKKTDKILKTRKENVIKYYTKSINLFTIKVYHLYLYVYLRIRRFYKLIAS